jgi:hypothetical protein
MQHRATYGWRRSRCQLPSANIGNKGRTLDRAIAAEILKVQHAASVAAVVGNRMSDLAFVKNARAFVGDRVQRVRQMRNDNGHPRCDQK